MRGVPQRDRQARDRQANASFPHWLFGRMVLRTGPFDDIPEGTPPPGCVRTTDLANRELAFLGDPLESFGRAFDTILAVVAIGRQQPYHLIGAGSSRTGNIAGSKKDSLSNGVLMLQRPLPSRKKQRPRSRSR